VCVARPARLLFPLSVQQAKGSSSFIFLALSSIIFAHGVWIVAVIHLDHVLELSDQKTQGFLLSIVVKRLFSDNADKLFGEISVRI
jgi:hypothetical protein